MVDEPIGPRSNGGVGNRIAFDYIKGQFFRVIRADGAIGSITPNGHIHMAFYSERIAIPRRQVHEVEDAGTVGKLIPEETVSRDSIVREMDVDLFLDPAVAEQVYKWLGERLKELKVRQDAIRSRSGDAKNGDG